jgi:hypothetical protein
VDRRGDMGSEASEKCYNVHHGLLRRLRVVVVVDDNSTFGSASSQPTMCLWLF